MEEINNQCPHCGKHLILPDIPKQNLIAYGPKTLLVHTECCNKPVNMSIKYVFTASKYKGNLKEDDWGNIIKK